MSTRCTINFTYADGNVCAKVYRHSDGYPDTEHGVLASLERFFAEVEQQSPGDTRFTDPSYLSARFIVWQSAKFRRDANAPLTFLSLGVLPFDPLDIEYRYFVRCGGDFLANNRTRPVVTWEKCRPGSSRRSAKH